MSISTYKSVLDHSSPTSISIDDFFLSLLSGPHTETVLKIRKLKANGKTRDELKRLKLLLPASTISGEFDESRTDAGLIAPSGYLCMDFDNLGSPLDVLEIKNQIKGDPYVFGSFLSVSGDLAIILKIDTARHADSFDCADAYFYSTYQMVSDKSGRNVSRLRYHSHDPEYTRNDEALIFPVNEAYILSIKEAYLQVPAQLQSNPSDFSKLVQMIVQEKIDITGPYYQWRDIAYGIARTYAGEGLNYFLQISQFHEAYSIDDCHKLYGSVLKSITQSSTRDRVTSLKTVFYLAKQHGIIVKPPVELVTRPVPHTPTVANSAPVTEDSSVVPTSSFALQETRGEVTIYRYIRRLLQQHHQIKFNILTQKIEVDGKQITDFMVNELLDEVQGYSAKTIDKDKLNSALKVTTWPNYHPIKEYFETLDPWDGVDRIEMMADALNSDKPEWSRVLLAKWLTGVVWNLYGSVNPTVLVLAGEEVGTGKSKFFCDLLPTKLKAFFCQSHLAEKDRVNNMNGNLIVFDDELTGINKMGIEEFKSLTSQSSFAITQKYEAHETKLERIASICASCNELDILTESVNRRYLPIKIVGRLDWTVLNAIDRDQLMAQMYYNYQNKFNWQILGDDIKALTEYGEEFSRRTHEDELVSKYCQKPSSEHEPGALFHTSSEVLEVILANTSIKSLNKYNIGKSLGKCKFKPKRIRRGDLIVRAYLVKYKL